MSEIEYEIDVEVDIRYVIKNPCCEEDIKEIGLENIIRDLIHEEGVIGICEDEYKVIKIKRVEK